MIRSIDVLFPGFSAAANFGALGWGTVALIKADGWVDIVDEKAMPRGGNDVTLTFPTGITMGGASEMRLYMDRF